MMSCSYLSVRSKHEVAYSLIVIVASCALFSGVVDSQLRSVVFAACSFVDALTARDLWKRSRARSRILGAFRIGLSTGKSNWPIDDVHCTQQEVLSTSCMLINRRQQYSTDYATSVDLHDVDEDFESKTQKVSARSQLKRPAF